MTFSYDGWSSLDSHVRFSAADLGYHQTTPSHPACAPSSLGDSPVSVVSFLVSVPYPDSLDLADLFSGSSLLGLLIVYNKNIYNCGIHFC